LCCRLRPAPHPSTTNCASSIRRSAHAIDTIRRDGKLPRADRLKTSITGRAAFTGTQVSTKGGAVRAKSHWYKLAFKCDVSPDQMKALSFSYEIGKEIPEDKWEDLGLWR